jgi:hypothetical protein
MVPVKAHITTTNRNPSVCEDWLTAFQDSVNELSIYIAPRRIPIWNPARSKVYLNSNLESGEERYVLRIGAPDSKIPALSFPYT